MSSILDALNKLEQEKVQAANEADFDGHIDPEEAAKELLGDDAPSERQPLKLTPGVMLLGGALVMAAMVATSAGVTMLLMRSQARPATIASAAALSESPASPTVQEPALATVTDDARIEVAPAPAVEKSVAPPAPVVPEPVPEPVAEAPAVAKVEETEIVAPPPAPKPAPVAVQEKPAPARVEAPAVPAAEVPPPVREEPLRMARSESVWDASAAEPEGPRKPAPANIRALPHLTPAIEQRYSDEAILLNMVSPATANRPYGYAIINRIKVTEGDRIGDSRFRLTGIESHGIALEAGGNRYYVPF